MSFSTETDKLVKDLIQVEYKNACEKFGEKYHSLHEGYAILLEELEEAKKEFESIEPTLNWIWEEIKIFSQEFYSKETLLDYCKKEMWYVERTVKELAQVGAVLKKIQNTIDEVEE